jgi:hypothetical protein
VDDIKGQSDTKILIDKIKAFSEQSKIFPLLSLADSLQPLRQYFNQNSDRLQFLALLSPT